MRRIASLLGFALLAACQQEAERRQENILENAAAAAEPVDMAPEAPIEARVTEDFAWTGRFAATQALCTGGVWDIKEDKIVTDGETSCDVDNVARAAGQVTLRLACTAEGMKSDETWTLSPREMEGITVARSTGQGPVDLIRCN